MAVYNIHCGSTTEREAKRVEKFFPLICRGWCSAGHRRPMIGLDEECGIQVSENTPLDSSWGLRERRDWAIARDGSPCYQAEVELHICARCALSAMSGRRVRGVDKLLNIENNDRDSWARTNHTVRDSSIRWIITRAVRDLVAPRGSDLVTHRTQGSARGWVNTHPGGIEAWCIDP